MAPLPNAETSDGSAAMVQIDQTFSGDGIVLVLISVAMTVASLLLVIWICACGGKEGDDAKEGEKKQEAPPPAPSAGSQLNPSGKAEPSPGSKSTPVAKSAREATKTKIVLTPPGATCPPKYDATDEDKTVNVEGLVKKA